MRRRPLAARPAALAGAALSAGLGVALLVGCGAADEADGGPPRLPRAEVEEQVRVEIAEQGGRAPEAVSCPDDLVGVVGETLRCTLRDAGATLGVGVSVTAVEGTVVRFDVRVDDAPLDEPAAPQSPG